MFSFVIEECVILPITFHMLLNHSEESSDSKALWKFHFIEHFIAKAFKPRRNIQSGEQPLVGCP
jgi:hypothetical protein